MNRSALEPVVCSIGCTDPTGAAGLFLDAAVYARLGVPARYVVAGVTAQNSTGVSGVSALPPRAIVAQLQSIWRQVPPRAVRIGLLPDKAAADAVARFFRSLRSRPPIVIDPVLAATSGYRFARAGYVNALRRLFGIATLVTPNASEAAELTGLRVRTIEHAQRAALALSESSGCAVLVKGGHLQGRDRVVDVLAFDGRIKRFEASRIRRDVRGTGCMLAAALTVWLARGAPLESALVRARAFVRGALSSSRLGKGRRQRRVGPR